MMETTDRGKLQVISHLQGVLFCKRTETNVHTHFTFLTSQGMLYAHRSTDPVPSVYAGFAPAGSKHRLYWGVLNIIEPSNHTKAQRQMCCIRNGSFREVRPHTNKCVIKLCMQMKRCRHDRFLCRPHMNRSKVKPAWLLCWTPTLTHSWRWTDINITSKPWWLQDRHNSKWIVSHWE